MPDIIFICCIEFIDNSKHTYPSSNNVKQIYCVGGGIGWVGEEWPVNIERHTKQW